MIFLPSAKFLYRPQTATNIVTPLRAWEADYGVQTVGADGVTVDAVPVSGNKVKQWTSKVGGIVLSQSVDANRPTYYEPVYGKPYIEMDGRTPTRYLTTGTASTFFTNLDKMTMAVAMRRTGAYSNYRNDSYISFNWGNSGIPTLMNIGGGNPQFRYGGDPGGLGGTFGLIALGYETSAETTLFGTFSTASTSQTVAGASVGKLYANGAIKAVNTATATTRTTTPGAMDVGRSQDPSVSGIKQFYGVYMYDQELTEAQVAASHADISGRLFSWHTLPVANPALWLDASRSDSLFVENTLATPVTTDNGPVGGWKDLSGNNRHALQSPTTARPTWRTPINGQNGLGVTSFNGSTQWIMSPLSTSTPYTQFVVAKIKDNTRINRILHGGNSTQDGRYLLGSSGGNYAIYLSAVNPNWTGGALPLPPATSIHNMWKNLSVTNTGTSTGLQPYVNNTALNTGNGTLATFSNMTIGYGPSSQYANMDLAEVIQYDFVLNATQLASVNAYLSAKWGT